MIDREAAIREKIKACEDRLVFLRALLDPPPPIKKVETMPDPAKAFDLVPKRPPGRPKKAA